ncbi:MAG TPA: hypothetical protein VKR43_02310 [Bryobacteraceae bacterium]|nr:hypothetical protein [Bryobacteraceae bacterium]
MEFDPTAYGPEVVRILALDGNGQRLMPLTCGARASREGYPLLKASKAAGLFSDPRDVDAAMAGLWLYFSCFEEAHSLAQDSSTKECELWHAILHRQEPDSGNAAYWFRQVGSHATFPKLARAAGEILDRIPEAEFRAGGKWDPFAFIAFCERARTQPGSAQERAALEIQRAEWQILFDYCARPA